jgi:uncharacterized surface protein with fasciclin (FAS1) repeats
MRTFPRHARGQAGALAASALAVTAAACGSSAPAAAPASSHHMSSHPMASHSAAMHEPMTIGTDCGMIPASGMGSMHGMSGDPVVTAVSHNPLLTTFAADVRRAGLVSALDSAHAVTVFAPDNAAFRKLSAHDMAMMSGQAELAKILKYHVVTGRLTPAQLAHSMTLTSLEGSQLHTSKMGASYEVNSAAVTCGNLQTANATVYIINKVLMPMH